MIVCFGGGEIAERGILPVVGGKSLGLVDCDVTDRLEVRRAIARTAPRDVVFTAGLSHPGPLGSTVIDSAQEMAVNLVGAFNVANEAIRANVETFIFIASLAGLYGKPGHAAYSASKAGVISLVQSLALEGHNAYAISPGRVNTAMRERDYPGEDPRTRLDPLIIGGIVRDMLAGKYTPGDNLVVRMRGHEVLPLEIHRGDGWRERLRVGEPPTC